MTEYHKAIRDRQKSVCVIQITKLMEGFSISRIGRMSLNAEGNGRQDTKRNQLEYNMVVFVLISLYPCQQAYLGVQISRIRHAGRSPAGNIHSGEPSLCLRSPGSSI